jgi:hypothetical protein
MSNINRKTKTKNRNLKSPDRILLDAALSEKGRQSMTVIQGLEQFSAYLALHCNPFNQSKGKGSNYSQTSVPEHIGALPTRNYGASGFAGGILSVAPGDVTDSVTSVHYTGIMIDVHKMSANNTRDITASASGVFTWTDATRSFPGSSIINIDELVRSIAAGINLRCNVAPGATSSGTIHAYIIAGRDTAPTSLAALKAACVADYHAPVSEGVTGRAPMYPGLDRWHQYDSSSDFGLNIAVIVEWDGAALPVTLEIAHYFQHMSNTDLGPKQINLDDTFVANVLSAVDRGDTNIHGHFFTQVPLFTSGNSFWSKVTSFLRPIIKTVRDISGTINDVAGKADSILG